MEALERSGLFITTRIKTRIQTIHYPVARVRAAQGSLHSFFPFPKPLFPTNSSNLNLKVMILVLLHQNFSPPYSLLLQYNTKETFPFSA